MSQVPEEFG